MKTFLINKNLITIIFTIKIFSYFHARKVKDNRNQENNARDLGIAYFLVFITYTILGLVFYLAYPGWKGCITDMFIEVSFLLIIYFLFCMILLFSEF